MSLSSHLFGLEAERLFDAECARRGIVSVEPMSTQTSCDRVVVTASGPVSVQIKGNQTLRLMPRHGSKTRRRYEFDNFRRNGTKFGIDGVSVLALFCAPENRWFLFRAFEVTGKRIRFGKNPTGRARIAADNWAILLP